MDTIVAILQRRWQNEQMSFRRELQRFISEYRFAERFLTLHPDRESSWRPLLTQAAAVMEEVGELDSAAPLHDAVRRAEQILAPIGKIAKTYIIHCVGHAHLDMNWMWGYQETVPTVCDTVATVLQLMREYSGFTYSQGQCAVYEILEKYRPDLLEEIRRRVREKRWEVTASHWVENDNNLSGSEALCRHLLYSRRYMKRLFDLSPEDVPIDWCPDTFGHAATLPDYLSCGKVRYCYLHRPGPVMADAEAFFWEGTNGSRILVRNDAKLTYNGRITFELAEKMLPFVRFTGGRNFMFVYGIGDHGGGPTRRDLEEIIEMSSYPVFPTVRFSTALNFFDALGNESDRLPVWKGELNPEFTGCYTAGSRIKQANRLCENRIADAQWASLLGNAPFRMDAERIWKRCLFQQFHDILPGSGKAATREYALGALQETLADTAMTETLALRAAAEKMDTSAAAEDAIAPYPPRPRLLFYRDALGAGAGIGTMFGEPCSASQVPCGPRPFVLFNPTETERREIVTVTVWDNPAPGEGKDSLFGKKFAVRTPDGTLEAVQITETGQEWKHHFVKVAFPAHVPSFGYAVYTVLETENPPQPVSTLVPLQARHHCRYAFRERDILFGGENEFVRLEIDPVSGGIARLTEKTTGKDLICDSQHTPLYERWTEKPHWMSSWCIAHARKDAAPEVQAIVQECSGPYLLVVRVDCKTGASGFTIRYELSANSPVIRIRTHLNWREFGSIDDGIPVLRMNLPLALDDVRLRTEIPFGSIVREFHQDEEVPALQFSAASGKSAGKSFSLTLVNDGKYGCSLDGNILRASVIRSSFDPDPEPECGDHDFSFGLLARAEAEDPAADARLGRSFNHAIRAVGTTCHAGELPKKGAFVRCSDTEAVFTAITPATEADGMILRFYTFRKHSAKTELHFHPVFGKIISARRVDLMEEPIPEGALSHTEHRITLPETEHGIHTIKVQFQKEGE